MKSVISVKRTYP